MTDTCSKTATAAALRLDGTSRAHLAAGLVVAAAFGTALAATLSLSAPYVAFVIALYGGLLLIMALAQAGSPPTGFGGANRITLGRAVLGSLIGGFVIAHPAATVPATAWLIVTIAAFAAALDLTDGWMARRRGEVSPFGARFDMETDALLILALSVLVFQSGKAGAWVLAAGLMRYLFVLAGHAWPRLSRPLPPSTRRKAICALQGCALIACMAPIVTPPASTLLAALALMALAASFAKDILYLAGNQGGRG